MEAWYRVVYPREEVRQGRSFNPDEFAIALEQVVAGTAPEDYRDPAKFFSRTCFTRALTDHAGMILRRLAGETGGTAPVLSLITQFGGGKTHTLTTLYHLIHNRAVSAQCSGVPELLHEAGLGEIPEAKVAVFVGNAWDPREGRETPWLDLARQLAEDRGVAALGSAATGTPPGTEALGRLFEAAGGRVLILFDEVLNFLNRHRSMADGFHAFIQNLTVAMTGTTYGAAVISLPRSQVEMTDWDLQWQDKITKVVRRVSRDLLVLDEAEISEVIRRRLFENLGSEQARKAVAKAHADWCFEHRAQLPPEWTSVDTATTEARARDFLRQRFEECYPFHPATLSVFQRKWQALTHYQQTRGTLAMLAQWVSWVYQAGYRNALPEPLIMLGSAPLEVSGFRGTVLGQLGELRLNAAIGADIAGERAHAKALDADVPKGPLKGLHQRVATAIFFESSGGQADRVAHLPELRFAVGGPNIDTTSVDNAAFALEGKAFFISRVGSDGFKVYHKATVRKAVNDRRASLDQDKEVLPALRDLIRKEFGRGAEVPPLPFPEDGSDVGDNPRLTVVIGTPETPWDGTGPVRARLAEWTAYRTASSRRAYPGALIWCLKKPGRELQERVEMWLAWKRVARDIADGVLGSEYDRTERADVDTQVRRAEEAAKDEVWASYRYVICADQGSPDGLAVIDLGAGHASSGETLTGRIIAALKSHSLLNEAIGAGYLERHWPPALKSSGAWPLQGLRQSFLNGALTRLVDPDTVLRQKLTEFVERGDFGLASGAQSGGGYDRVWYAEPVSRDEIAFDSDVYLLQKGRAKALKADVQAATGGVGFGGGPSSVIEVQSGEEEGADRNGSQPPVQTEKGQSDDSSQPTVTTLRLTGTIPPEIWNRLGTRLIPKLRTAGELSIQINVVSQVDGTLAPGLGTEVRQILEELGLGETLKVS